MPEPRLLTRPQLRQYLGSIPWSQIEARMQRGKLPNPVWGLNPDDKAARWDKNAVDRALDHASSIPGSIESDIAELDRQFGLR
jgi:hypothetical protein